MSTAPFVESDPPHETRLRAVRPRAALSGGEANALWQCGALEIRALLRTYAACMDRFGVDKPWRDACEVTAIDDLEISGLAFS